ncbi:MAG: SsrA-binding protein SmpB [Kiritimatiellae bacterium]|nr:SsrA-binding protein SmpB [Kiritimatiellia bacterium]
MSGVPSPSTPGRSDGIQVVAEHRRARHDYEILDTFEAGLELRGTEVKSLRARQASLAGSYAQIERGEAWLVDCHIAPYAAGNIHNHEPRRPRRLLLHRREIDRLAGRLQQRGLTLIPLKLYFRRGRAKVELALARGKTHEDRRETLRRREADREATRAIRAARRR